MKRDEGMRLGGIDWIGIGVRIRLKKKKYEI